jgi:hypothetical protein
MENSKNTLILSPMHGYVLLQPLQIWVGVAGDRECDRFNAVERSLAIRSQVVTPHDYICHEGKVDRFLVKNEL